MMVKKENPCKNKDLCIAEGCDSEREGQQKEENVLMASKGSIGMLFEPTMENTMCMHKNGFIWSQEFVVILDLSS